MTTLFNLDDYNTRKVVHDPYWDEIVLDSSGKVEDNGQVTLFYDGSDEPPDPDDYPSRDDFDVAWSDWERSHPDFKPDMTFPEQEEEDFIDVLEESKPTALEQLTDVLEDLEPHSETLPEQPKQWIEKYHVTRGGIKYWYFRYCYYNRKIYHIHIPGGSVESAIAISRKEVIEKAIALGKTPFQIENYIRGGFGMSGYKLL